MRPGGRWVRKIVGAVCTIAPACALPMASAVALPTSRNKLSAPYLAVNQRLTWRSSSRPGDRALSQK